MAELIRSIQENEIQELKLHGRYHISAADVAALAEALKRPDCSVQTLALRCNRIGDAGFAALAEALKTNRSVHTLDLSFNDVGAAGAAALAEIEKEIEVNRFLNARDALPILDAKTRNLSEYQARCSTLRKIYFETIEKFGITMLAQSSEFVPEKIRVFLDNLEARMLTIYGNFESILSEQTTPIEDKKIAFRATIDMLQCLLKPGRAFPPLARCIRYLREEEPSLALLETPVPLLRYQLPLLSYRLLLEAASEVLPKLEETPALQSFVATLLRQDVGVYNPVIAGQLMAIPEVMSCLRMAPVLARGAAFASLDSDDTQPVLIDCYVREDSQPVVLQAAIITEESLVSSNPSLAGLGMFPHCKDSSESTSPDSKPKK